LGGGVSLHKKGKKVKNPQSPLKVAMLVVDGNDVRGSSMKSDTKASPNVHPAIEALLQGFEALGGIEIHVLFGSLRPPTRIRSSQGAVHYHSIPYRRVCGGLSGAGFLGRFFSLRNYVRSHSFDLVHAQGSERESAWTAVFSGIPSVITLHGLMGEVVKMKGNRTLWHYWVAALLERLATKRTDGVVAISPYALRVVLGITARARFIPNAVRSEFYQESGLKKGDVPTVLFVGNLTHVKRPDWFIRAVDALWKEGLSFKARMLCMGNPKHPYFNEIVAMADRLPASRKIDLRFNVSDVAAELAQADILFAPSTWESMGIAVCEAMAKRLCVVGSRIEANIPLLGQGCGVMFSTDNFKEAVDSLRSVILDPELRGQISEKSLNRVKSYAPDVVAGETIDFYREILKMRSES
jgi:glycosyltransferase involved in cell wall biosynthesis